MFSSSQKTSTNENFTQTLNSLRMNCLKEIKSVSPNLAHTALLMLSLASEAAEFEHDEVMKSQVKTSQIHRDFSDAHITWLYQVTQLKKDMPGIYEKIILPIRQVDHFIDKYYDIFIRNKKAIMQPTAGAVKSKL